MKPSTILISPNMQLLKVMALSLTFRFYNIEDIQGYVAASANHTDNKRLQKELDRLFEIFQVYLDTYDDQSELDN